MSTYQKYPGAENSLQEHTAAAAVGAVPPCEDDLYIIPPCWDVLYTPNNNPVAQAIVQGIQANNPSRLIPDSKVSAAVTPGGYQQMQGRHPQPEVRAQCCAPRLWRQTFGFVYPCAIVMHCHPSLYCSDSNSHCQNGSRHTSLSPFAFLAAPVMAIVTSQQQHPDA